ncbi:MAG: acyltransferase family protein [Bradymonadales bacterium]|nr:acyltransferase family protein [Bradymonadales bacterium]
MDKTVILERFSELMEQLASQAIDDQVLAWIEQLDRQQDEFGFDPFGFQPGFLKYVIPFGQWLYRSYFRTQVFGIENLSDGPVLVVANHSGQIPLDGFVIVGSAILSRTPPRLLRSMVEKWVPDLPFVSFFLARCGQVVGTPENCVLLLSRGEGILVFPEGVRGISKTFDRRYQLEEFGLGFMRLALETGTPIVPLAVIGAEEQAPSFVNARKLARLVGAPSFPITPTFPWLGLAGLFPYPVRYRLHYGTPMRFEGDPDDEDRVLKEKVEIVRQAVQDLVNQGLEKRRAIFW